MVGIIDETLRDGPQSLWATRMRTESMLGATDWINRAGFRKVCVTSGAAFETAVRFLRDDPWERLRLLHRYMPDASIEILIRSRNLFGWALYPDEVVEVLFRCLQDVGTEWVKVFDGLNDFRNITPHFRIAKELGLKASGLLTFSLSPAHTDDYFAGKVRELIALDVDSIIFADASGLLTTDRARSVLAALNSANNGAVPIEFYVHDCIGMARDVYREALAAGVDTVATASEPLANGESLPATLDVIAIADEMGIDTGVDADAVRGLDDYFHWVAYEEGRPIQAPAEFDPEAYKFLAGHQIPGGMMSNFRDQLTEIGLIHRIDEVLEEAARVRAEIGYPVMVTPFSQFVGVQAVFNVIEEERYKTIPNELVLYVQGHYGEPPGPIDGNVRDRVMGSRPAEPIGAAAEVGAGFLADFKRQNGPFASDEEMLLHLFYGRAQVEALGREKSIFDGRPTVDAPLMALVKRLSKDGSLKSFKLEKGPLKLDVGLG
jgi:oxaloacetate decarboxylase (Na+ extruding) subunit alpha